MSNQCIVKVDYFDVSFRSLFDHLVEQTKWALIYVNESWSLQRKLLSSLYDHSAEQTKWALIYVFAMHVFFSFSLSACSLWLWYYLDAVCILNYM